MKKSIADFINTLTSRQRLVLGMIAVAVIALLYVWLTYAAAQARAQLQATVTALRAQSLQLEQQSAEFRRLRTAQAPATARTDLRTVIQTHAERAGIASAIVKLDAVDGNQVQLTFGALSFAEWLEWVRTLQPQRTRVDSCRIEALATSGMVSISATLVRAQ